VLKADSLRITAQRTKALYQLTVTEDALADRKEALNRFARPRPPGGVHRRNGTRFTPRGIGLATSKKSRNRDAAEIKAETIKKERAALDTKIERTRYIPDISIQANYATTPNISFLPQNVGAVGVLLTWQPWDWGRSVTTLPRRLTPKAGATFHR